MGANQTSDAIEPDVQGDRFNYVTELPSLREIASYRIALAIRFHDSSPYIYNSENYINLKNYDDEVESLTESPEILDMIKNYIKRIKEEFSTWVHHFSRVLFCQSRRPYKLFQLDANWCVWLPNGQIDYLKTGMKMLKSGKLNEVQKFIISCEYCLEDEIKKVSLEALPTDFIANTNYYDDGILFYWIHFLKNTLHEVPLEDFSSAETAMVRNFQRYSRFAIECFWHCSSDDDQFIVVSEWISSRCNNHFECDVLERLISTLSWHQQSCLLTEKSNEILINLSLRSRSTRCALWAWKYCKGTMSDEQFSNVVDKILRLWQDNRRSCPTLTIIWETAYDHQRNFAARALSNMIIDMCLFRHEHPAIALEFLNRFLPLIPVETRKSIISGKTFKMETQLIDLSTLDVILDLCFPNPYEKLVFQYSVINFEWMDRHALEYMLEGGDFKKFNLLLEYYFSRNVDGGGARALKKTILDYLDSMFPDIDRFIHFICDIRKWQELGNFIDKIFPNHPFLALNHKQRFVESAIKSAAYKLRFDKRLSICTTIKIVEMIFKKREQKDIKRTFAHSYEESLKTRSYWENEEVSDETYLEKIFAWCLGNNRRVIVGPKRYEWPDIILHRIFYRISELYQESRTRPIYVEILLTRLNKYLKWYLACDYQVKWYKLYKFNVNFEQLEIFRLISTRKDSQTLKILLEWFLDDDDDRIREFTLKILLKWFFDGDGDFFVLKS